MEGSPPRVRTTASRVRQGRWGRHMVWVLLGSLFLAVMALFAIWALRWGDLSKAEPKSMVTHQDAATFHAPARTGG